jgi:hypothetical protein
MSDAQNKTALPPRRSRWWLRLSLRGLLLAVTALAIGLGYISHRARQQEQAVRHIERLGGRAVYAYQVGDPETGRLPDGQPPGPQWLTRRIGPNFTGTVIAVVPFSAGEASDQDLEVLRALPKLQTFTLGGKNPKVSDQGLRRIGTLTRLKWLGLHRAGITDEGLVHLKRLNNVAYLSLSGCKIDGSGLRHIQDLPIQTLDLNYTNLIADKLAHVTAMKSLTGLSFTNTPVTDDGLIQIRGLTNLRRLGLEETAISDRGLVHLEGLKSLKELGTHKTNVTKEGLAKLKLALPALRD